MESEKKNYGKNEEKIEVKELTDEQANEAAGGVQHCYICSNCRSQRYGSPFIYQGKCYCANCLPKTPIV